MNNPKLDIRKRQIRRVGRRISAALRVDYVEDPVEWVGKNVDLGRDLTSDADCMLDMDLVPFLKFPLRWSAKRVKHARALTAQACEQTAKSTLWRLILLWTMKFRPVPAGLIYQNKDVGQTIIRDSLVPVMKGVTSFREDLSRNGWSMKRIMLAKPVYLMTGDGEIISYPQGLIIGDEINKWRQERAARKAGKKRLSLDEYQVSKIKDMDKRGRTFSNFLRLLVCSPEGAKAPISTETEASTQSHWHMRCQGCGELTMDSTLPEEYAKYSTTNADEVIVTAATIVEDSIRMVCPECEHEHVYADLMDMNAGDGEANYIHAFPERLEHHLGVCWGTMAAPVFKPGWQEVCRAVEHAKRDHTRDVQQYLHNSIKGLPYRPQQITGEKLDLVRTHKVSSDLPQEVIDSWEAVYMSVDTQDEGYWWVIEAVDPRGNWFTLDYGFAWEDKEIVEAWKREYFGHKAIAGIIDEGGHRKEDVNRLVAKLGKGWWKYKGEGRVYKGKWRMSDNEEEPLLILAKALEYQADWLYLMYTRAEHDRTKFDARLLDETQTANWYICCEIKKTFLHQMAAVQPPLVDPDADYRDWLSAERQHDLFDCCKMGLVLHDYAKKNFKPGAFLAGSPRHKEAARKVKQVKPKRHNRPSGLY